MLKIYKPKIGELTSFSNHVLIWVKSGQGMIEVDFQRYADFENKLIFLSPDQHIKFVFGEFEIALLEFSNAFVSNSPDYRVLFKHLISLGYIEFSERNQQILTTLFNGNPLKVLDISTNQWFWQNPFNANKEEYTIIFDVKEVIDRHFHEHRSVEQLISNIHPKQYSIQKLIKNRLGLTVKNLAQKKLLIESQKDIALTDKPIQEVAYDLGFKDPAYFNRFFKKYAHLTPLEFRNNFGSSTDTFIEDLLLLINQHHKSNRSTSFYADKTHTSIKTLSRKVKNKLNMTVGDLIRVETINSAKKILQALPIKETAFELGFEEANHFSAFFKKYTGLTPTEYQSKKYNF